jgi:molybdopterin-guanine dinucleotide biosynthesis protein A
MGTDKLSLEVGGTPLLRRVHDALAARCREVLVVGGAFAAHLPGVRRVAGERPGGLGPLAGLEAGLAVARNPLVFVAAGDMPFLTEALVGYLLGRLEGSSAGAVVPRYEGRTHPLHAAYRRELLPLVETALDNGVRAARVFLDGLDEVEYVDEELLRFGDPDLFLMNVNTPEDLRRARYEAVR